MRWDLFVELIIYRVIPTVLNNYVVVRHPFFDPFFTGLDYSNYMMEKGVKAFFTMYAVEEFLETVIISCPDFRKKIIEKHVFKSPSDDIKPGEMVMIVQFRNIKESIVLIAFGDISSWPYRHKVS